MALLAGLTITLGSALLTMPIQELRLAVGALLLILGLQWLKKALLRTARRSARRKAPVQFQPASREKIDWYAFVVAFKGVLLEGLEIAFVVVTFGAEANRIGTAATGAAAALVLVAVVAFLICGWLSRVPREWLRLAVGLLLAAFGMYWAGEGALVQWPGGALWIPGLLALMTGTAFAYLALLRDRAA